MYGDVVLGLKPENKEDPNPFEEIIEDLKRQLNIKSDIEFQTDDLKFMVTGGSTHDDDKFIESVKRSLADAGVMDDVTFVDHFHGEARRHFLSQLTVLSVPGEDQSGLDLVAPRQVIRVEFFPTVPADNHRKPSR